LAVILHTTANTIGIWNARWIYRIFGIRTLIDYITNHGPIESYYPSL
jgi:hypothetical protein